MAQRKVARKAPVRARRSRAPKLYAPAVTAGELRTIRASLAASVSGGHGGRGAIHVLSMLDAFMESEGIRP